MNHNKLRPLYFSLEPQELENEMFVKVPETETYFISNLGRVKNKKKSSDKILLPYQMYKNGSFYVKIQKKQRKLIEVIYLAFHGAIKDGLSVRVSDGNSCNLDVKNLTLVDLEEEKQAKKIPLLIQGSKPLRFTKSTKTQYKEVFKPIKDMIGRYEVSNYGRVRRLKHKYNNINYQAIIISPSMSGTNRKFRVSIQGIFYCLQDLMFDSFIGLEKNQNAFTIDGNPQNLHIDNLDTKTCCHRTRIRRQAKEQVKQIPKPEESKIIDLNKGEESEKLKELNGLKKYYYIASSDNGKYLLKLKKA